MLVVRFADVDNHTYPEQALHIFAENETVTQLCS